MAETNTALDILESARAKMAKLHTETVNGMILMKFQGADIKSVVDKIGALEINSDDVILDGYQRSGNHWTYEILRLILDEKAKVGDSTYFESCLDFMSTETLEKVVPTLPSPRLLTSHYWPEYLPRQATEKRARFIFLFRNPKDAWVSWYRLTSSYKNENLGFFGSWDEFFELQMAGEFLWSSYFDFVLKTEAFIAAHPELPVHLLQYEELKAEPVRVIRELCRFLGRDESVAEAIEEATRFDSMKSVLKQGKVGQLEKAILKENTDVVLYKGTSGGWKDYFSPSQNERFHRCFKEKLAGSKLGEMLGKNLG
ncbi:sulfotransferase 1C4 [Aplysia californica]|uniref:Sulfotransferase 1C4 n=1 Tax=Aplysia californica TaxID=6500 RepID=A0ABM0JYW6_APLCA|nr:sulfotransferase 1C4 [Aplysia californica]XP_005104789.1 sulfotransferase 1C4 [Aplysia californica]